MRARECARRWAGALALAAAAGAGAASGAEPAPYRYQAPIAIDAPAAFVQMPLSADVYAHAAQDDLRDLRIVDARGERVPFAILPPVSSVQLSEQRREATLYPLPMRPATGVPWPSPVDVVVDGDRISVRRHGAGEAALAADPGGPARSPGWLIDTGEARRGEPPPQSVRLSWSAPAEFSAAYRIETSDDLRQWHAGGSGQVMALQSAAGALMQPVVGLAGAPGRFVRLLWADPATAPRLTGASVQVGERQRVALDSTRELTFAPSADASASGPADAAARRALRFDLGAALPLIDIELRFASGTHVAPVRVQGRTRADEPWRDLGSGVFYRLERAGDVGVSPPIALPVTVRELRLLPDERAAALDSTEARLVVHASLASLVFAAQGEPPFRLLAGSRDAPAGALPVSALVPQLETERPRFGRATVGAFKADERGERAAEREAQQARLRPVLLWAVLLLGVAALGALVWRLARSGAPPTPPA